MCAMATTLPTITVTDAQAQRLLAAFGTADNYKKWLKIQLVRYVLNVEAQKAYDQHVSAGLTEFGLTTSDV